jgi:hypothetical protein
MKCFTGNAEMPYQHRRNASGLSFVFQKMLLEVAGMVVVAEIFKNHRHLTKIV